VPPGPVEGQWHRRTVQVLRQGQYGDHRSQRRGGGRLRDEFTGRVGYLIWGFIHVLYLIGWDNRIITLYSWLRALSFTHHRGERIVTVEQAHHELTRAATRRELDELNRLLSKRA
jgi:hypothetical protein